MATQTRPCPVCQIPANFTYHHPDADLYRCGGCDHCFSDATSLRRKETYAADYYEVVHPNWFRHPHTDMFTMMHYMIQRESPGARSVLDVGCGKGNFLRFLSQTGAYDSLTGNDLSPMTPFPSMKFMQGDFISLKLPQHYDVVVSLAVIEHIGDVREFSSRLIDCCKPGGLILVMTMNDRSVLYELTRFLHRINLYHAAFERLYSSHHLNHFNNGSLQRLFQNSAVKQLQLNKHNAALGALDIPGSSVLVRAICRLGVWGTLTLGSLAGKTFLQTILLRKLP